MATLTLFHRHKGEVLKWSLVAIFAYALYLSWNLLPVRDWSMAFTRFAESQGGWGVIAYALVYIVATVILFPCALLTFAAGMAYGYWGFPLVIVSSLIGACLAFFIGRKLLFERVTCFMERRPNILALRTALERDGWKLMLLFRINPVIPFTINNYFLGTLNVGFATYFWVTALGTLPGTTLYIHLGAVGRDFAERGDLRSILLIVGALATFAVLERVIKARTRLPDRL